MSPADNAAKEPSMDEILASIRRIIEDNDTLQDTSSANNQKIATFNRTHQSGEAASRSHLSNVTRDSATGNSVTSNSVTATETIADKNYGSDSNREDAPSASNTVPFSTEAHDDFTEVPPTPSTRKLEPHRVASAKIEDTPKAALSTNTPPSRQTMDGRDKAIVDLPAINDGNGAKDYNRTTDIAAQNKGTGLANMISSQAAERVTASFDALTEAVDANKGIAANEHDRRALKAHVARMAGQQPSRYC